MTETINAPDMPRRRLPEGAIGRMDYMSVPMVINRALQEPMVRQRLLAGHDRSLVDKTKQGVDDRMDWAAKNDTPEKRANNPPPPFTGKEREVIIDALDLRRDQLRERMQEETTAGRSPVDRDVNDDLAITYIMDRLATGDSLTAILPAETELYRVGGVTRTEKQKAPGRHRVRRPDRGKHSAH